MDVRSLPRAGLAVRRFPRLPGAVVAALAIALLGVAMLAVSTRLDPNSSGNRAIVDTTATSRVVGDVSNELTEVLSYSPDSIAATQRAAAKDLTGKAAQQYHLLFGQVAQQAPLQGISLSTRVVRAGVIELTGDSARLLVFLDQTATRAGATAGSPVAAQLTIGAQLSGDHWLINDIEST